MGQVHRRTGALTEAGKTVCAQRCALMAHTHTHMAVLRSDITCWLLPLHYSRSRDWLVMSGSGSFSCPFSRKDI